MWMAAQLMRSCLRSRHLSFTALFYSRQVVPVFAGGLDFSAPVRKFFYDPLGSGKNYVNTVVSLTGAHTTALLLRASQVFDSLCPADFERLA